MTSGAVYVGKKVRGKPQPSVENAIRVDVTSGSKKIISGIPATTLSPLKLGPIITATGIKSEVFENFWQYSKVYPQLAHVDRMVSAFGDDGRHQPSGTGPERGGVSAHVDRNTGELTEKWYKWRDAGFAKTVGKRTPSAVSDLKRKFRNGEIPAWTPAFSVLDQNRYGYLEARRAIYVPYYYAAIKNLPIITELKKMVANGISILIIDVDGPADVIEIDEKNILAALDDPSVPFGHGYIVAAAISGDKKILESLLMRCSAI